MDADRPRGARPTRRQGVGKKKDAGLKKGKPWKKGKAFLGRERKEKRRYSQGEGHPFKVRRKKQGALNIEGGGIV